MSSKIICDYIKILGTDSLAKNLALNYKTFLIEILKNYAQNGEGIILLGSMASTTQIYYNDFDIMITYKSNHFDIYDYVLNLEKILGKVETRENRVYNNTIFNFYDKGYKISIGFMKQCILPRTAFDEIPLHHKYSLKNLSEDSRQLVRLLKIACVAKDIYRYLPGFAIERVAIEWDSIVSKDYVLTPLIDGIQINNHRKVFISYLFQSEDLLYRLTDNQIDILHEILVEFTNCNIKYIEDIILLYGQKQISNF